jgi:hypothetical protein
MMRFPSVAWLGPAPAHANDALAGLHALGGGLGCRGHGTVASKVGLIFGAEAFDHVGACGLVGGVAQDEWIAEDTVLRSISTAISPGLGLPGAPARLFPRRIYPLGSPRSFFAEGSAKGAAVTAFRRVASAVRVARMVKLIACCPLVRCQGRVQVSS